MYVGWRELRWARGRFVLIGSVIVLITVLVGLLSGLTRGLGEQSTSAITGLRADAVVLAGDSFDSSRVSDDLLKGGVPLGIATLRGLGRTGTGAVAVLGVPPGSSTAPDARGVAPGAVVLSQPAAELLGTTDLSLSGRPVTVAAVRGDASYSHLPVVWTTLHDWQRLTGSAGHATALLVDGTVPPLPAGTHATSVQGSLSAIGSYRSEHGSLLLIRGFLLVISALVVGAFFTVWTIQRSGDVAVLKALGATSISLLRDALGQAAVVLVLAATAGTAVVLGVGRMAAGSVPFALDPSTLLLPVGLLWVLGLAGAALAVRRVLSVDPLTALNGR